MAADPELAAKPASRPEPRPEPISDGTADATQSSELHGKVHPAGTTEASAKAEDWAIVQQVRGGDHDAFAGLVQRHGDRLFQVMLHLANRNQEQAAEFVQEAFVRAFERLEQFDGRSAFYTWLYRLARNRAIDLLAKCAPKAVADPSQVSGAQATSSAHNGEQLAQQSDLHAAVHAALGRLSTEQREIIILRDFDGLDYATIAQSLGIAEGTVKSRLSRARGHLRQELVGHVTERDL